MEDDPLRLYVARCLALGYAKQRVRERLLEAGYTMPEVDSVLEDTPTPFKPEPTLPNSERFLLIAGVLVFVLVAASSLLWLRESNPTAFDAPELGSRPEKNIPAPLPVTPAPVILAGPINPSSLPSIPARIGWPLRPVQTAVSAQPAAPYCPNYDCLISAVDACTPRQYLVNAAFDVENLSINSSIAITLGGQVEGGCTIWLTYAYQRITFYQEYADELQSLGLNSGQVDLLEAEANQAAAAAMPARAQCVVRTDALKTMFSAWRAGSFTSKQLIDAGCPVAYG